MRLEGEWHVVRHFRMRPEFQPVPINCTPDNEPIRPDWLAIVHAKTWSQRRPIPEDCFILSFLRDDGHEYDFIQCSTLEIALDQARSIAGIPHSAWTQCRVAIKSEDGVIRWSEVVA